MPSACESGIEAIVGLSLVLSGTTPGLSWGLTCVGHQPHW